MKDYKIELTLTGAMTQVPDSQKLFGALIYLFAETYGNKRATELTKAIQNRTIHVALSNVLPEGYLPTPVDYLVDKISGEGNAKEKRAAIKKRSYLRMEDMNDVLQNKRKCEDIFPYVMQLDLQQLRASIDSIRYHMPALDSRLYSVPTVALFEIEIIGEKEQHQPVKNYCFYLQLDDSGDEGNYCADILSMLYTAAADKREMILGKRASQGLNLFQLQTIIEQKIPYSKSHAFLNTGMLLPDCIDFKASFLKLFTSERRPFEMAGGWNDAYKKQFISFLAQGSILFLSEGVTHAGKSIDSPFRKNRDIVFGNAYLYPVNLNQGEE